MSTYLLIAYILMNPYQIEVRAQFVRLENCQKFAQNLKKKEKETGFKCIANTEYWADIKEVQNDGE